MKHSTTTLVFDANLWKTITHVLAFDVESAGIILAGHALSETELTLFAKDVRWVPDSAYTIRGATEMIITSEGFVPALKESLQRGLIPIFFHTHPKTSPLPSPRDHQVDLLLRELFADRGGRGYYVSLVIGGTTDSAEFTGTVFRRDPQWTKSNIERLRLVGPNWAIQDSATPPLTSVSHQNQRMYDRQMLAFGEHGQNTLRNLRVGVVGAGGTGSAVCELLLRLGVGSMIVADPDLIEETNLTRIHHSGTRNVGHPKVDLVREEARLLNSRTKLETIESSVVKKSVVERFKHCDVIFGCTDDNAGRAVLSRMAHWYMVPLIDMGFIIESTNGVIHGLFGRVTTVMPGTGCLICRHRVDPEMIRIETMADAERSGLQKEGYAPGLNVEPSVGTYTTMVATFAVHELLDRLFGSDTNSSSETLLLLNDWRISRNAHSGCSGHYCTELSTMGIGDVEPFLGQVWPND